MEAIVQAYNNLLKVLEDIQKMGKLTLGEASAIFSSVLSMKNAIDEGIKDPGQRAKGSTSPNEDSSSRLKETQVQLMTRNIELQNLKERFAETLEQLNKLKGNKGGTQIEELP
ncbi:g872 [Coccomyxa elongata]|jgi:hypothetical protein